MLKDNGIEYRYREYTETPLNSEEIRTVLGKLGMKPRELLRKGDAANRVLGLTGDEAEDVLVQHMSEHPTLLQRPIGILNDKAVVGRPPEKLLELCNPNNKQG